MGTRRSTRHEASAKGRKTSARRTSAPSRARSQKRAPSRSAGSKRIPLRAWLPLAAVLVLAAAGWTLYPTLKPLYEQTRAESELEAELEGIKDRNADLRKEVTRLRTPQGIEEAARSSLGWVRPGEKAYVVIEDTSTADADSAQAEERSWWYGVYESVFGASR